MSTQTIEKTIEVAAPIDAVYKQWTQFESFPQFMTGVKEITQTDATHTHWVMSINGIKREFDAEIIDQEANSKVAWKSIDGPDHGGIVTFDRIDENSTQVNLQMDWEPEGATEKIGSALGVDSREATRDLDNFKELMESNGFTASDNAWQGSSDSAPIAHEREPATAAGAGI